MSLMPDELDDGTIALRRCLAVHRDVALDAIHESWTELHQWLSWAQQEITPESYDVALLDYGAAFDANSDWRYFSFDAADKALLGAANLYTTSSPQTLGIGYWVRTSRTRQGLATRAARLLTSMAFDQIAEIGTVEIQVDVSNAASLRVPRKLGFHCDAEIVKEKLTPGSSGRAFLWRINRDEWTSQRRG